MLLVEGGAKLPVRHGQNSRPVHRREKLSLFTTSVSYCVNLEPWSGISSFTLVDGSSPGKPEMGFYSLTLSVSLTFTKSGEAKWRTDTAAP